MHIRPVEIHGLFVVEPRIFGDDRGWFMETWHQGKFAAAGIAVDFVQDNHSRSVSRVLRGLHYQLRNPQGKLVRAARGEVWDVAVDLRRNSATFGKTYSIRLSDENKLQFYIPPGFAHGFCVLSDEAEVIYKCTTLYDPADERTLLWNDPALGIDWPVTDPLLSPKDLKGVPLAQAECFED